MSHLKMTVRAALKPSQRTTNGILAALAGCALELPTSRAAAADSPCRSRWCGRLVAKQGAKTA